MTDSLFVPSFGNRPRNLIGREAVLQQFQLTLNSPPGSRDRAILLLGQRGSGKTVLLWELADLAKVKGFIVAPPTIVTSGMLDRILEKLEEAGSDYLAKPKAKLSGGSVGALGFSAGLQLQSPEQEKKSFAYRLSVLCRQLNEKGKDVLILIDEVQANSPELKQLIVAFQELVGEGRRIAIVFAGLPMAISSTLNDHVLTFLNRAVKISLPPLRIGEIEAYFSQAFSELGVLLSDERITEAAEATEGSPFLMQLIGHYLTVLAEEQLPMKEDVFQKALSLAKRDFKNDVCGTTLAALSEQDRVFLETMAQSDDAVSLTEIAERMGVSNSYAQLYKRRLIQAGVIMQPQRGFVSFAVPYLKDYLSEEL